MPISNLNIMQVRILLILFFLLFQILKLHAQVNLVPNPSFEEYKFCPDKESQIDRVFYWNSANNGTPDYYNACSTDPSLGSSIPIHQSYFIKNPKSGNGMMGIYTNFFPKNIDQKEFINIKLKRKLNINKQHYLYFYISPRNGIKDISIPCFIDKIGISLNKAYKFENTIAGQPIAKDKYIGSVSSILDKIEEWTRISGCILGDNEEYITIGNFFTNEETMINKECLDYFPNNAYYYIDDVGVYEFDPLPDTILLCDGKSERIGQKFLDCTYNWNTGSLDSTIVVSESGTYIVHVALDNCILSDTVLVINMNDIGHYLPKDTTLCGGVQLKVEIPIPGKYFWNTGSNNSMIQISNAGTYNVHIENQCGTINHSFNIMSQKCDCQVQTSNIFSPNDDTVNDEMVFYMNCQYPYSINWLKIYDRWGSLVFEEKIIMEDKILWNGKVKGKGLSTGIYCWVINYSFIENGQEISKVKTGNVTIVN